MLSEELENLQTVCFDDVVVGGVVLIIYFPFKILFFLITFILNYTQGYNEDGATFVKKSSLQVIIYISYYQIYLLL